MPTNRKCNPHIEQTQPWQRNDGWLVLLLMGLTLYVRWPFQAELLSNHDAVNYALALDHFDMRLSQPHPPGYILYVLLGRTINFVIHDPRRALIWLSIFASGLAVVAIYLIGRDVFNRYTGIITALMLCFNPTFWFFGEVALPYTLDLFASAFLGWLCWRMKKSQSAQMALITAFSLGLAGAFRPQTMVFLLPLFLYSLWSYRISKVFLSMLVLGLTFAAFFLPSVMMSGGPLTFLQLMQGTVPVFRSREAVAKSIQVGRYIGNVDRILRYVFHVLGEISVPLLLVGTLTAKGFPYLWRDRKLRFLTIWVLPTWLVYLMIWPGNLGTIFVCMPPFFLLSGVGLTRVLRTKRVGRQLGTLLLLFVLMSGVVGFILFPHYPLGERYRGFDNYRYLVSIDTHFKTRFRLLDEVSPNGTIVFANNFRHLQYYRPNYRVFSYPYLYRNDPSLIKLVISVQQGEMEAWSDLKSQALIPDGVQRIVFFDLPRDLAKIDSGLIREHSRNGHSIYVITVPEQRTAFWTENGLELTEKGELQ